MTRGRIIGLVTVAATALIGISVGLMVHDDPDDIGAVKRAPATTGQVDTAVTPRAHTTTRIAARAYSRPAGSDLDLTFADAQPAPGPWILRGLVVNAVGEAVAGARVFIADPRVLWEFNDDQLLERGWFRDPPRWDATPAKPRDDTHGGAVTLATTDSAGRFQVDVHVCSGFARAFASHDEQGDGVADEVQLSNDAPTEVVVRLHAVIGLYGTVTDAADGKPLWHANVTVMGGTGAGVYSHVVSLASDAAGRWWSFAPRAPWMSVTSYFQGYFPEPRRPASTDTEREVRVDLPMESMPTVTGRLVDVSGGPAHLAAAMEAPGTDPEREAFVWLSNEDPLTVPNFGLLPHANGELSFDNDTYTAKITLRGIRWVSVWYGRDVMLGRVAFDRQHLSPDLLIDSSLIKPAVAVDSSIALHVIDAVSGLPVNGYIVTATRSAFDSASLQAEVFGPLFHLKDVDGRMTINQLRGGKYRVVVSSSGHAHGEAEVSVPAHGGAVCEIALQPPVASISGTVRDHEGKPLAGISLVAFLPGGILAHDSRGRAWTTPADGSFTFDKLADGDYVVVASEGWTDRVVAVTARARPVAQDVVITFAGQEQVIFEPTGAIGPFAFRVLDAAGSVLFDDRIRDEHFIASNRSVSLPAGKYVVECHCPTFETARIAFTADHGPVHVPIPLIPRAK